MKKLLLLALLVGCAEEPKRHEVEVRLTAEMLTEDLWIVQHDKDLKVRYFHTYYRQEEFCPQVKRDESECEIGEFASCIVQQKDGSCSSWTCDFTKRKIECDVYFRRHEEERILDEDSRLYRGRNDYGTFIRVDMKDKYEFYGTRFY